MLFRFRKLSLIRHLRRFSYKAHEGPEQDSTRTPSTYRPFLIMPAHRLITFRSCLLHSIRAQRGNFPNRKSSMGIVFGLAFSGELR